MSKIAKSAKPKVVRLTFSTLVSSIRTVHEDLAAQAGRAVNISVTLRNWTIGCYIAEYELHGADRAKYGERLLDKLSLELESLAISACGKRQLYQYLRFYQTYPQIVRSVSAQFRPLIPDGVALPLKVRSTTAQSAAEPPDLLQRLPTMNKPGGFIALSRWLSETRATPPDVRRNPIRIPEGC